MKKMNDIHEICNIIDSSQKILILPHIFPDGDTIGSSIALCLSLLQKGKKPYVFIEEELPQNLKFLPVACIHAHLEDDFIADLIITVDCSDINRLGNRAHYLDKSKKIINIDHHITNTYFAQNNLIFSDAAATGEIIYLLIKEMGVSITKDIATCLYVALSTDTGSFRYDNTTASTHRIAAELLGYGIDLNLITTELYQNKPLSKVKLLKEALNGLEIYYSGQVAILSITSQMLKETGSAADDTDGLIEFARDIAGVKVGVLIKEVDHSEIKVGFRSKDNRIDVSEVAAQFGGGGHRKASGCTIHGTLQNAKEQVVSILKNYL